MARLGHSPSPILAGVIIGTYNRREALIETLKALSRQRVPSESYEVVVVDDGSTDGTWDAVKAVTLPYAIRVFRHATNEGISAARNLAIRNSKGNYVIFMSDDLIVPEDFIVSHVQTLERYAGYWVVGGFRQLPSLRNSAFGRYLDDLEERFVAARKVSEIQPDIWELNWPTARNLSLPRKDLDRTGLFDERFRTACEDQDLTHRARDVGIRFLYNASITCLHNDQVGDLKRYCRAQRPRTHDTALFCAKYPLIHGSAPVAICNGYVSLIKDSPLLIAKKLLKWFLSREPSINMLEQLVDVVERWPLPDFVLRRLYRLMIGLNMFRGWREGLRTLEREKA